MGGAETRPLASATLGFMCCKIFRHASGALEGAGFHKAHIGILSYAIGTRFFMAQQPLRAPWAEAMKPVAQG